MCKNVIFIFSYGSNCVLYGKYFSENFLYLFMKSEKLRYDILFYKFELMK